MKKLVFTLAIALGSFSTFATPISGGQATEINIQEEFIEIKTEEVPEAVLTALKTSYPDASLEKAYVNSNKEYKLDIAIGTQKAAVYADANGNWIKK